MNKHCIGDWVNNDDDDSQLNISIYKMNVYYYEVID